MISSQAIIDSNAQLHESVVVEPFAIIGPDVVIGEGCWIGPNTVIKGPTKIGKNNRIFQFCSIGDDPQDKKYAGENTHLEIGDNNIIREYCSINRGTAQDLGKTQVGSHNLLMAYVHVAHDCVVGDNVILANAVTLAGHVHVSDWAIMAGFSGAHQFCHIGAHAFIGMQSGVVKDVPPYVMAMGQPALPKGLNTEGLSRRGFSADTILEIKRAYKVVYRQGNTVTQALELLKLKSKQFPELEILREFISNSSRGIIR
ncbi:MAG: acyl-ACP--UDP-N-acetylglucosamine O-acyltransferase [Pseudomonadota bacterium]